MSNVIINCPYCQQPLQIDESLLGRYADCPSCGRRLRLEKEEKGSDRLSMTVPLVFQSITLGFLLIPIVALVAIIPGILAAIFVAILHYRCWKALPEGYARLTPGMAVGLLFVPFFGFYWAFPSFYGLAQDCANWARIKGLRGYTHLPALGLTYAILSVVSCVVILIPFLNFLVQVGAFVIWILLYRGILAVLNGKNNSNSATAQVSF